MIALQKLADQRKKWMKWTKENGYQPLPRPAGNLLNHISQLQGSEQTLLCGAADPLIWLELVAGHEAGCWPYTLTAILSPSAPRGDEVENDLNSVTDGMPLRGKLKLTTTIPSLSFSLAVVDIRYYADIETVCDLMTTTELLVVYGIDDEPSWLAALVKIGKNYTRVPWGKGFLIFGEKMPTIAVGEN